MFSILILTKDEEVNLRECLESVSWCDDVVVLDSFSTDRTVEIAKAGGARVVQRAFDDFAGQRNFALDQIQFKHPWLFHLDADERFTATLRAECEQVIASDQHSGYLVPSKLMLNGRWLKYSGCYPAYQMRLLRLGEVRFVQHGHGQREVEARRGIGTLREPYLHHNFSKGMDDWWAKHRRYAEQEARQEVDGAARLRFAELMSFDVLKRRRALKHLSSRLPFRPLLRFLYLYVIRRGFLDGSAGYQYARLLAAYEKLIVNEHAKLQEKERQNSNIETQRK